MKIDKNTETAATWKYAQRIWIDLRICTCLNSFSPPRKRKWATAVTNWPKYSLSILKIAVEHCIISTFTNLVLLFHLVICIRSKIHYLSATNPVNNFFNCKAKHLRLTSPTERSKLTKVCWTECPLKTRTGPTERWGSAILQLFVNFTQHLNYFFGFDCFRE